MAVWESEGDHITIHDQPVTMFRRVFDHAPEGKQFGKVLLAVHQGKCKAAKYAVEFRTLAAESEWNEPALKAVVQQGLNENICTEMTCRDSTICCKADGLSNCYTCNE